MKKIVLSLTAVFVAAISLVSGASAVVECPECTQTFERVEHAQRHMKINHFRTCVGVLTTFECPECPKTGLASKRHVHGHAKIQHPAHDANDITARAIPHHHLILG